MQALLTLTVLISSTLLPPHLLYSTNTPYGPALTGVNYPESSSPVEEIPTIAFCEMVRNPQSYFDRVVRVTAVIKLATEGIYLSDDRCLPTHGDGIGAGFIVNNDAQRDTHNRNLSKIRSGKYGSQARVTIVGMLRDAPSKMVFAPYRYRFDIISYEDISQVIVPYEGVLQEGLTYRAEVQGDSIYGLSFVRPLRARQHVAVHLEWTNLNEFPSLTGLRRDSRRQQIVFSVISDKTSQIAKGRWNRTLECKIARVN